MTSKRKTGVVFCSLLLFVNKITVSKSNEFGDSNFVIFVAEINIHADHVWRTLKDSMNDYLTLKR